MARLAAGALGLLSLCAPVAGQCDPDEIYYDGKPNVDVGAPQSSVAIGDLDGDGVPELAVANYLSNNVSVLMGNGDGSFATDATFAAGNRPVSIAIGDVDGDGIHDLAVANEDSDDVSVLMGNGDGTFAAGVTYAAGAGPR